MLRGLRATDVTCGGTSVPRLSPRWLKYELICRARRAASVTRANFESTRSSNSSMAGFIIVSWAARAMGHSSPENSLMRLAAAGSAAAARPLGVDDLEQLVHGAFELVVDHPVVRDGLAEGLLVLGLAQARRHFVRGVTAHLE